MAKKVKYGNKQVKVWSYKVDHPLASASEVAKATNTSYGYVYKLFQNIGTPREVFEAEAEAKAKPKGGGFSNPAAEERARWKSRGDVLDTAKDYITKDRAQEHGNLEGNFKRIADYWNTLLGLIDFIKPEDVGVMMSLLKIARIHSNSKNIDNYIDSAGYIACSAELSVNTD